MKRYLSIILIVLAGSVQGQKTQVFEETILNFNPDFGPYKEDGDILHLDAGRVLMKEVKLPVYDKETNYTLKMELVSNGDPWDKGGSVFMIRKDDFSVFKKFVQDRQKEEGFPLTDITQGQEPASEIMRFMTPFGVGFFSDTAKIKPPIYVPEWEDKVVWERDITSFRELMETEFYVGIFIDTWTKEGYKLSLNIEQNQVEYECATASRRIVKTLMNTNKYFPEQKLFDGLSRGDKEIKFDLKDLNGVENAWLEVTMTGHGGHSEGDEFTPCRNQLELNGDLLMDTIPWRNDCASFRRFNPSSGVWLDTLEWRGQQITERIASSDLSRSNWCPGSMVEPYVYDVTTLLKETNSLVYRIPTSQPFKDGENNYWIISVNLILELKK